MGLAVKRATFRRIVRRALHHFLALVVAVSTLSAISIPSANAVDLSAAECPTIQVTTTTGVSYGRYSTFCLIRFTSTSVANSFTPPSGVQSITLLVVGGGGAGGAGGWSGGGGAGSVLYGTNYPVTAGTSYSISVGAGGAGVTAAAAAGNNGTSSTFGSVTASGGGGGAGYGWGQTYLANGRPGGSGGGAAEEDAQIVTGGLFVQTDYPNLTEYGNRGGNQGNNSGSQAGAGGGGAGSAGVDVPSSSSPSNRQPGAGGAGLQFSTGLGTAINVAGGGGGASSGTRGLGGTVSSTRLGGNGGQDNDRTNIDGVANTGSGGGGSQTSSVQSGAGGSGIVAIGFAYNITYNANNATGGSVPSGQDHGFGATTILSSNTGTLARTGYTFVGWNTQADGLGTRYAVGASYATNTSLNLFAQWTSNSNNSITYDNQGATSSQSGGSTSYTFGSAIATIPTTAPLKSGYNFAGWYTASSAGTQVTNNSYTPPLPYGSITLYAQWTASTGNAVTYDNQGATTAQSGGSTTYTTGSAIATIPTTAPIKTGYSFSGWYTESTGGTRVTDGSYTPTSPFGTVTLYARWTANTNNGITYDNQGATTAQSGGSTTYTTAAAIATIPTTAPIKSGYLFKGWFTAASGGTQVTNGSYTPVSPFGTVTLYAQWSCDVTPNTSSSPGYTILRFTAIGSCDWTVPAGITSADILVVGGGGAGGTRSGGGGGAGGYLYFANQAVTANQATDITVGAGGVGVLGNSANNGGDSSFGSLTIAKGGGGGGGAITAGDTARSGKAGGSGGGAAGNYAGNASAAIGLGTSGQGFNGGLSVVLNAWPGGGGGGSASVGLAPTSNTAPAGKGGGGTLNSITGTSVCYATGGGAGTYSAYTAGAAGDCGGTASPNGGAGTAGSITPTAPTANSGAGGGGSGWSIGADVVGGNGANGVVIVRYVNGSAVAAAITTQPTGAASGSALATQPVIRIVDAAGNTVTSSTVSVVASIASGGGTLSGTTSVAAVNGVATFTNLVITGTSGNRTLTFTPTSLTAVTSSALTTTEALSITTPSGASLQGTYNTAFTSLTIASSGGAGTNSFTATGSLPAGVTLSSAGVISGTPTTAGSFALTVTVTDANGATATTSSFTIVIAKGVSTISITIPSYTYSGSPQGPDSVTKSGSTGSVTYAYAGRGSTTYAISSTKPTNVGTYTVTATLAADSNFASVSTTGDFAITAAALSVPASLAAATVSGVASAITVTFNAVTGASSYTVQLFNSGGTQLGSDYTSFTSGSRITGLTASTAYSVKVIAVGNGTNYTSSAASSAFSVTTLAAYYLNFAGSSPQYGFVASTVIPSTGNFTVEAWIAPTATSSRQPVIVNQGAGSALFLLRLSSQGKLEVVRNESAAECSSNAISLNSWTHVAVSINGGTATCYVNGVAQTAQTLATTALLSLFYVGIWSNRTSSQESTFAGQIDEIKIWNTVRTQAQIADNMILAPLANAAGLVAYYPFDATTGTTVVDVQNSDNNLTLNSTMSWLPLIRTVAYAAGTNGSGTTASQSGTSDRTAAITLKSAADASGITRTGFVISAWNTNAGGTSGTSYALSASYLGATDLTLYPTWTANVVAPTIGTQPTAAARTVGQSVTFTVVATASDSGVLSYQWQKGGADISGATSASYTFVTGNTTDAGNYQVVVTNTKNTFTATTTSTAVALTMSGALSITTPTSGLSGSAGTAFTTLNIASAGGTGTNTFALASGTLPAGLSLSTSGAITGTPTTVGTQAITVRVTDSNTATATTTSFTIAITAGAATKVAVTRASVGTQRGAAFSTQPQVTVQDAGGNTVTSSSAVVTATVSAGGTLVGTVTATASSGVATFTGLGVNGTIGTTYTITYTVSGLTVATATVTLTGTTCDASFTCQVGDTGPGGGIIFYVAPAFFTQGGASGSMCTTNCKYLEAAPVTWAGGSVDPSRSWATNANANQTTAVNGADGTAIGTGYRNSLDIVGQTGNVSATSAAVAAREYAGGSKNDWFLPSKDELNQMCKWQRGVAWTSDATVCTGGTINTGTGAAGFVNSDFYWSSSEHSAANAWLQSYQNGSNNVTGAKTRSSYVRPIRAFGPAPIVISVAAIAGVTAPVAGATPVTTTTAGTGYTGTVAWSGSPTTFAPGTIYTATITLTAAAGYTLTGVTANFFTVTGATPVTNLANAGVVSAVFPATASSNVATLSGLTLTTATLSSTFASGTTSYTSSVVNGTTSITVTPTHTQSNATITVNGTAVTSGSASGSISLNVGSNTITVIGTAQDGTTTATYTITVTRAGASDANLSAFTISSGTLSPTFAAATTMYTASVTNATTAITVTSNHNQANATITVNGTAVTSGSASGSISLNVGANTITVVVTAQDGTTTKTYTVTVTRAASNDASLSSLIISSGTLSPTFAAATTSYTATVTNATTSITVTPTRNQANATITVNSTAVISGSASGSISLNIGNNTVTVIGTAQDGTTTRSYTLTIKRLGPDTLGSATFIGTQVAWTSNTYFDSFSSQSGVTTTDAVPTNNMVWQMFYAHKAITIPADGISRLGINTYQSGNNSIVWWISKSSSTNTVGSFSTPAQISAQTLYNYSAGGFNQAVANSAASIPANTYFIVGVTAGPYYRSIKASGNRTATIAGENVVTSINTVFLGPWGSPSGPTNGVPTALGGLLGSYTYGNGGSAEYTQYDGYQSVISIKFKDVSSMSSDATLSGLTISSGTLSPTFASSTTSYSATVTNATSSITVTPTRNNANATITVNGTAVTSGSASTAIALSVGSNTITVVGTAENGTTSTYTITVTRQAPTYTVTYNGNSNTGGSVPTDSSSPYVNGASVTVLGNSGTLVRTNFTFNGWNTAAAGTGTAYAATGSATFTMGSANVILYAQWIANAVITSFSTTSGSATGNLTQITIAGTGLAATTSLTIGNVTATIVGTPTSTQVIATLPTSTITGTKDLVLTATYNTVTIANSYESCGTSGNFFVSNNSVVGTHYCVGSVVVPEGVTTIGNCAFATAIGGNCGTTKGNLFTTVTLPNSLRTISAYGFLGATMSSIDIPEGVTAIGNSAFYMGSAYSLRIPSTVTSVNTTFYKTNATSITFAPGSGITSVTDAFRLMPNIYSIVLPDSVTTVVGTLNFSGTSFATITMRGVTSLAAGALPSTLTCIVTSANNAAVNNYSYAGFTTLPLIVTNISSCPQPTITSLSVTSGSFSGSTSTVITGTHLINTTGVTVGGNAAVITAKTTTSVTITTPAGSVGPANIVVTTEAGSVTGSNAFTYTKTLTVTLDKNYVGSTAATTTVASNATLSTPTALTRTGFTFLGWSTSSSGSVVTFPYAHGQTDNFTLYAIWSVSVQTITYAAGTGGTGTAPTTPTSVNSGSTFTTPANTYSRAGYTFAGWSDGTSVYAAGATYPTTGTVSANVTLTSTWTANSLTITYDSKSGSSVSNGSVNTAASISAAPTAPTRAGYTLSGWSATDGGTVVTFPFAHGKTADFTMYAVWAANALAITYDSKSGSSVANGSVNTGASISAAPTAPTRAGYTFAGWSATDGGTAITFPYAHGQTANFTLYAIWTANSLTVTYNSKGGTAVSNGSVNTAASISSAPTAPTRAGYTFSAWSATDGGTAITFPYAHGQTANFTLYALWTAGTLVITFDSKGGTSVSNGSTSSGASISAAPTAPTKTGYTLAGWSASDTGTVVTFPFAHGQTANFTLYAQWTGTTNTITYDSKSGSSVANGSFVTDGSISSAPTAPTRAGYTLTGWSATDGGSVITYPYTPSATSGITLYAIWAPISCSPTAVTTGGYTIYTFTTVGTCFWTVPNGLTDVEILAVAGGGGGGYSWDNTGAGGGAGGQVKTGAATLSTTLEVTVGAGGSAGIVSVTRGGTGGNSSASTVTALGGTGGCAARATTCANSAQATSLAAANGGVGGSGGASGKGGGGSNTAGTLTTTTAGGTGTVSSYSGSAVTYGVGGAGGTARGALTNIAGVAGTANTGNGGGGASAKSSSGDVNGGAGGAGLVLVRVANGNTVVFDANTGTGTMSDQNIVSGAATALTTNSFTKTGYTFSGWNTNADGISGTSYTDGQSVTITAGVTLYAKWTLNTYAIVFNANSGVGTMGNQSFTHGVATILNASLYTRANYVFYRWATAADGSGTTYSNLAQVTLTAGVTLYAQWTPNTYVVTYNYNEATGGNSTTTASFTTGESAIVLPTPTKTGYTFAGWFSNASLLASIGSAGASYLPTGTTLSLTAYAKWTPIDYTFTYDANSADLGTVPTETSKQITQTATVKANTGNLIRVGYTFGGWNTLSNGSGTNYFSGSLFTVGSSNVVLYAKWTANTYTVTYNVNGGTGNAQRSSTNVTSDSYTTGGSSVSIPAAGTLERSGYTFAGWNTSASGSGTSYAAGDNYTTISNVILYAKWNAVTYTITYNGNTSDGGTAPITGGYTTGQASPYSVLTNTYTKTSNIFGGWNTAANGTGTSYSPGATITTLANIVLYATWIPQYTLHYAINGGTVTSGSLPGDQLYNSGASVGPLFSNVSRTGYRFDGWVNGASTIAGGGNFTILADSVLTAKWTPINYTISYNSDGGSDAPDPFTKQIGQSYTVGSAVFKPGYNFAGWSNGSSVVGADATVVMGSSNVSYTAQWVAKVYIVSYDWNGGRGTAVSDVSYTFGTTAITLPLVGDRVKDGYTFAGWSESSSGSALNATYIPSQSRTLYALWNVGNFTVTFDPGRGTVANSSVAVLNGGSTVLPLPTRSNFVFNGWHTAVTGGSSVGSNGATFTPTASQTIYARWIQSSLYGITESLTRIGSVITTSNMGNTFSGANSNSSVAVSIPANALPAGTTINFDLVGNSSRARGMLPSVNYLVSIALSWLTGDETVPDTAADKPITVTISNNTIKAGAAAYAIINNVSTLLGTATEDGKITVTITSDPEIVVAATKPNTPRSVVATSNGNQQSVVSWSAPSSDGGSEITGYIVRSNTGATCTSTTTSCTISNLANGTAYTFTVEATNIVGTSTASTSASATTAALYTVTFNAKGGTTVTSGTFLTDSTVTEPTAPTRAGYSFAGWSATDGGSAVIFPYAPGVTSNITMFARWDALDNAVTFDSKGGSSVTASVFSSGGNVTEPTAPTRSGYTFAGWSATDGGSAVTFPYAPSVVTDIILFAKWAAAVVSGGGSTPAPTEPITPVRTNVTVVAPVTVVGNDEAKIVTNEVFVPISTTNQKPAGVQIDDISKKFIADIKVVDGKLVITPVTGFSGKKTVTATITENGVDRIIQIPLTVLPENVTKPVLTPVSSSKSTIRWAASPNADAYTVYLNGKKVCSTPTTNCSVARILGPDANVEVVSNGGDSTVSQRVDADFKLNGPLLVTRVVSATKTKGALSSVDTTALYKVILLVKTQGFKTVVISKITTTKKTEPLAAARIAAIKKFISEKSGVKDINFEIAPATSNTYFNNIYVKG